MVKTYNHRREGPTYVSAIRLCISAFVVKFLQSFRIQHTEKEKGDRGKRKMTRGKQKIEAQKRNAERNQKAKGSQLEARAVGLKVICPICKVSNFAFFLTKNFIFLLAIHSFCCYFLRVTKKLNFGSWVPLKLTLITWCCCCGGCVNFEFFH